MKFTDGFWQVRPGVEALYAQEAHEITTTPTEITALAPTRVIAGRGDVLNRPTLTVTLSSPLPGVVRVRAVHFDGAARDPGFELPGALDAVGEVTRDEAGAATLTTGNLAATITPGAPWNLTFAVDGNVVTQSGTRALGFVTVADGAPVPAEPVGETGVIATGTAVAGTYLHEQLGLDVGETIYGLGERFTPFVKNGQTVDIWNADGGTSSEQAYKNIPFYLSSKGYGVLVNNGGHVSYEIGTENVEAVQFSVKGETLEYFIFAGPTPKEVLKRYTALLGRPAKVPAWTYGLWLTTSFTTDYDEKTVTSFVNGMRERDIPLSVFHFDCFWMKGFQWTDFVWDADTFPDPEGMLSRLHDLGLHISAWINPYIAQRSRLFAEGAERGFLVKKSNGDVWQWDMWQAGMALVDFTNPEATSWFQGYVRTLLRQGVDAIKTDFGERIPTNVVYHDGTDPMIMHNRYTHLYNRAVFQAIEAEHGVGEAVLFARSATAGGQQMPVHWGGDNSSSFVSMAESLRGGLSLASSGFGFWSHDIGGFEGMPDPAVFKRWAAFGLLSSHSRLHGSGSYRVPWAFDDEAVDVTRAFAKLKMQLMPYLYRAGLEAHESGVPVLRPMYLEFPDDLTARQLDRQYMLGSDLLVAPVFTSDGRVQYYLPAGEWTNYLTGEIAQGGGWREEIHDVFSLPLWVRPGAVIPRGAVDSRPDYDYLDGLTLVVYPGENGTSNITVVNPDGVSEEFVVDRDDIGVTVRATSDVASRFAVQLAGGSPVVAENGEARVTR